MNPTERAILEVEFVNRLQAALDQLVREDFPEQDVRDFIVSVKTFLKFADIKDYVKQSLYEKAKEISRVFLVIDKGLYYSYKKFISILVSLDDPEVIEMLETSFAKEKNLNNFFLLIEEEMRQDKSIANCENLFFSLITLHQLDYRIMDDFLNAIQQDRAYAVEKLIEMQSYATLRKYIQELASADIAFLNPLIPVILEKYTDRIGSHYIELVRTIVGHTGEFIEQLLPTRNLRWMFQTHILHSYSHYEGLITNYALYLYSRGDMTILKFEKEFLEVATATSICSYAINVPFCNKRRILRRLVELKDEDELVYFIKQFPEYENLLPLL